MKVVEDHFVSTDPEPVIIDKIIDTAMVKSINADQGFDPGGIEFTEPDDLNLFL